MQHIRATFLEQHWRAMLLGLPHAWVTCWVTNYLLLQIAHSEKLQSTCCPRGLQKKQGLSPTCYATMLLEKLRTGICCLYYRLNATKVANKLKLSRGCHARLHNFPQTYKIYGKELWHNKYYLYTKMSVPHYEQNLKWKHRDKCYREGKMFFIECDKRVITFAWLVNYVNEKQSSNRVEGSKFGQCFKIL